VLNGLDAYTTTALLDAVTSLNVADSIANEIGAFGSNAALNKMINDTLQLCKVMGWGPSQVWSLPAADIDRLLAMIATQHDSVPNASLSKARPPNVLPAGNLHSARFNADPGAVVIHVEDD